MLSARFGGCQAQVGVSWPPRPLAPLRVTDRATVRHRVRGEAISQPVMWPRNVDVGGENLSRGREIASSARGGLAMTPLVGHRERSDAISQPVMLPRNVEVGGENLSRGREIASSAWADSQ